LSVCHYGDIGRGLLLSCCGLLTQLWRLVNLSGSQKLPSTPVPDAAIVIAEVVGILLNPQLALSTIISGQLGDLRLATSSMLLVWPASSLNMRSLIMTF
jgi:hypothetical protein